MENQLRPAPCTRYPGRTLFSRIQEKITRAPFSAILVLSLLLIAPSLAWADYWYEHYARAETAIANAEWDTAVEELQQALERKGDSGARVRSYGMKVVAYFPYLKLGIAYYHLGQHEAALQAFQTEEQLGAVLDSREGREELSQFRALAIAERDAAARAAQERIAQIADESLREADILQGQGRLEDAMETLGKALAVDPENPAAIAKMAELRSAVARRDRRRRDAERASDLISRGRESLAAGEYATASSLFQQALTIQPDPTTQQLLDQARQDLVTEIRTQEDAEARRTLVASGLARAREFVASGDHDAALDSLQRVLAAEPENRQALALQRQILDAQADVEARAAIEQILDEAAGHYSAGRFEAAISAANRALALDPGNAAALDQVTRSYGELNNRLLGSRTVENIPPAIRFADFRIDQADGERIQIVRSPAFRLNGVVIDNSPVEIAFRDGMEHAIEGRSTSQPLGEFFVTEFAIDEDLRPGPTVFTLTATDAAGLNSGAEYAVMYVVPFYRTPWFQLGVAALPVGVLLAVWGYRARRRQRLMKRRFNPYIAGAPVLDLKMFFGREQLVERILQTIHNNSLLLYGERRIGKTSLQHHIRRRLQQLNDPQFDFYPVYIDLQGTPESQFFATLAEDIFHELGPSLGGMVPDSDTREGSTYGYRDLVHDLRRVIKALEERSEKRVKLVLLIDEVDELNAYDPRINQRLRSLFMKSFAENLVAVVSGVEIRKQWDREGSPWYNFFEEIEVTPIGRENVVQLITQPVEGVFKIDDSVIDRIIELTERKPYRVQRLCIALVNRAYEMGRRTITRADVDAVAGSEESPA